MADLTASDVTLTITNKSYDHGKNRVNLVQLAVGDGVKKYPAAGYIPLPAFDTAPNKAKYGLHSQMFALESVELPADGLLYRLDRANMRLYIYQSAGFTPDIAAVSAGTPAGTVAAPVFTGQALAAHDHNLIVKGGITADEDVGLLASGPTLGKLAATDRVIVGADQATKGGVVGGSGGTPAGTNTAPAFTGAALATHDHTGVEVAAAALAAMGNVALAAKTLLLRATGK